jgi:hypothetical protein
MKTQCPYCKEILDVPDAYRAKQIKCKVCNGAFVPAPFKKPPVHPSQIRQSIRKSFAKLQLKSVPAFKTAFFATLGVLTALWLAFYIFSASYRYQLQSPPGPGTPSFTPPRTPAASPSLPPGTITSAGWKTLSEWEGAYFISWQVKFRSFVTGDVNVDFCLYDEDGYLLHKATLYRESVREGQSYTFTAEDTLMQGLGPRVSSCDAKVRLN